MARGYGVANQPRVERAQPLGDDRNGVLLGGPGGLGATSRCERTVGEEHVERTGERRDVAGRDDVDTAQCRRNVPHGGVVTGDDGTTMHCCLHKGER